MTSSAPPSHRPPTVESIVDRLKPKLVHLAEGWVKDQGAAAAKAVEASQLRLLLQAARSEPREVLVNLLRYQIGRKKGFYSGNDARTLGETADVDGRLGRLLQSELPRMAREANAEGALGDEQLMQLERELATQLLGFAIREHTFQAALTRGNEEREGDPR